MNAETRIKTKEIVGWREIDGKIILFNPRQQEMAILNEAASFFWKNTSQWTDLSNLSEKLVIEYGISYEQAKRDIVNFVKEIFWLDVLEISNSRKWWFKQSKHQAEIKDENLLLKLEKLAMKKTIPFSVTFELTQRCNEECIHCYMPKEKVDELTTQEVKNILIDLVKEKCIFISFTGGEIFTRPDLFEIIDFASKQKFVIDLLSNGTLINDEITDFLKTQIIRRVQISLYASKPKIHDRITRREGSFKKTLEAIDLLTKRNIKVEIAFPIMKLNFDERHSVKTLAEELCHISEKEVSLRLPSL